MGGKLSYYFLPKVFWDSSISLGVIETNCVGRQNNVFTINWKNDSLDKLAKVMFQKTVL